MVLAMGGGRTLSNTAQWESALVVGGQENEQLFHYLTIYPSKHKILKSVKSAMIYLKFSQLI